MSLQRFSVCVWLPSSAVSRTPPTPDGKNLVTLHKTVMFLNGQVSSSVPRRCQVGSAPSQFSLPWVNRTAQTFVSFDHFLTAFDALFVAVRHWENKFHLTFFFFFCKLQTPVRQGWSLEFARGGAAFTRLACGLGVVGRAECTRKKKQKIEERKGSSENTEIEQAMMIREDNGENVVTTTTCKDKLSTQERNELKKHARADVNWAHDYRVQIV